MELPQIIELAVTGFDDIIRLRLLTESNAEVVKGFIGLLPLETFLLHVVVAGQTIYMPSPTITLTSKHMVERRQGVVYYNTTSQSICLCYGDVTESTLVNQFAQVFEDDMEKLVGLGRVVLQQTIRQRTPTIVKACLQRPGSKSELLTQLHDVPHSSDVTSGLKVSWRMAKIVLDREAAQLRLPEEPENIKLVRLGATQSSGSGQESSPFPTMIFLQGFLSTLGPHVFSRLLAMADDPDMTLPLMIRQTRVFLTDTFNHFTFLADLGLSRVSKLGKMYDDALGSLEDLEGYKLLTDSMRTLIQILYRWLHLVFPWFLKDQFQGHSPEDASAFPKLSIYHG